MSSGRGAPGHGASFDEAAVAAAHSTPWDAPLVPPFPFAFRGVDILTTFWRTDPAAVARLVPPPLEPLGDVAAAHVYRMRDVEFAGSINECNVMVGVRLGSGSAAIEGGYSVWQFLDSDVGVAHGREVHGQPKKLADVALEARSDLLVGTVERNGIAVLTATMPYKQRRCEPETMLRHFDFREAISFKSVPGIDGSPAIRQLTARRLADVEVRQCYVGPCTVELRPNAQAPLWRLPVLEPLEGYFWQADFTLVGGRVVHDYLADRREGSEPRSTEARST